MESLPISKINEYLEKVSEWNLEDNGKSIVKNFEFKNFLEAMSFINRIAQIAEQEAHHPEIKIYDYNKVEITLTTHSALGLTEKDFAVAEKIDGINSNN